MSVTRVAPVSRFALAALLCAAGACSSTGVGVERVRGLYSTHFDAIPDSAALCATLVNRSGGDLTWVRLRVRAHSRAESGLADEDGRWTGYWVFAGGLPAGATRSVLLWQIPIADAVEVELARAGGGPVPRRGRRAREAEGCTEAWLARALEIEATGRTAPNQRFHPISIESPTEEPVVLTAQGSD